MTRKNFAFCAKSYSGRGIPEGSGSRIPGNGDRYEPVILKRFLPYRTRSTRDRIFKEDSGADVAED